jgi:hypothetical protein
LNRSAQFVFVSANPRSSAVPLLRAIRSSVFVIVAVQTQNLFLTHY